ncbi:hypothetical protein J6590_098317 [Homalodisca vitripennis]|nr:hypothetical protein J6590_098317 [Homalodisca vitripennis]
MSTTKRRLPINVVDIKVYDHENAFVVVSGCRLAVPSAAWSCLIRVYSIQQ